MTEYGYEIIDAAGNKNFFVEGCTDCSLSTGGVHQESCRSFKGFRMTTLNRDKFMDENLKAYYRKKGLL